MFFSELFIGLAHSAPPYFISDQILNMVFLNYLILWCCACPFTTLTLLQVPLNATFPFSKPPPPSHLKCKVENSSIPHTSFLPMGMLSWDLSSYPLRYFLPTGSLPRHLSLPKLGVFFQNTNSLAVLLTEISISCSQLSSTKGWITYVRQSLNKSSSYFVPSVLRCPYCAL